MKLTANEKEKVYKRKLRYSGIIVSGFISVQCVIWIVLCIIGLCCFYIDDMTDTITFDAFKYVYLDLKAGKRTPTLVSPLFFNLICWFYLFGCCTWLIVSIKLILVLYEWINFYVIRKCLKIWILITFTACAIDFIFSALFLVDFHLILKNEENSDGGISYAFKVADSFDLSLDENIEEIKAIEHLERDIRNELKEYLLLKAHVKSHYIEGSLPPSIYNVSIINPFHKAFQKIRREVIMYGRERSTEIPDILKDLHEEKRKRLEVPSAILMTLFIRGIIGWVVNLIMATAMSYMYLY